MKSKAHFFFFSYFIPNLLWTNSTLCSDFLFLKLDIVLPVSSVPITWKSPKKSEHSFIQWHLFKTKKEYISIEKTKMQKWKNSSLSYKVQYAFTFSLWRETLYSHSGEETNPHITALPKLLAKITSMKNL